MDKFKKVLKCIITVAALALLTCFLSYFYMSKNGPIHRKRFYEQKKPVDVLFMGTSHAYGGYQPMELYEKYGISAFNLATAGERFAVNYYSLLDAFEYHVPRVCVIDCHGFEYGNEKNDPEVPTRCHGIFDGMPMSALKIRAVKDVLSDRPETWPEYFFPLYYYHNRWSELERQDFEDPAVNCYGKGGRIFYGMANAPEPELVAEDDYVWEDDYSTEYAEKIVQLCREKGVDVYFMCIPFPCDAKAQRVLNRAKRLEERYDNCTYINLMNHADEIGFDYGCCMSDMGSHVSFTGATRLTDYIGEYLKERYDFTDYRTGADAAEWEQEYTDYTAYMDRLREKCETYQDYLDKVFTPAYSYAVYVSDMKTANSDKMLGKLIKKEDERDLAESAEGSYYFSNLNGDICEESGIEAKDTVFGAEYAGSYNPEALVNIVLYNNRTGETKVSSWSAEGRL